MNISKVVNKHIDSHFEIKHQVRIAVNVVLVQVLNEIIDQKSFTTPLGSLVIDVQDVEQIVKDLENETIKD